jgi:aspartyl protease family protein
MRVAPERVELARPAAAPTRPSTHRVALRADARGHYTATATVNGRSVPVMVDTGATAVALSADSARSLGIRPPPSAFRLPVSTANGVVAAAPVTLREVRIGGVSVRNVEAIVVPGDALGINLLGMTFLSRLSRFEVADGQLVLTQ